PFFSSRTFSSLPSLRKVQPWNGQVKDDLLPRFLRPSVAPRCEQVLSSACSSPSLVRVITTGRRPTLSAKSSPAFGTCLSWPRHTPLPSTLYFSPRSTR